MVQQGFPLSVTSRSSTDMICCFAAAPCCPAQTVRPGDTVPSLAQEAGLPANIGVSLVQNYNALTTDTLNPGDTITLPCPRVLNYFVERLRNAAAPASAPGLAPISAPTGAAAPAAV